MSDLRFDYEARAVKDAGGIVVGITRPRNPLGPREGSLEAQHISERGVDPKLVDVWLVNDFQTKEEWEKKVKHELAPYFVE